MSLTHHDIRLHNPEIDNSEIITSCGEFPNIPLIGRKGCINYKPMPALHQLGYTMDGEPLDKDVEDSIFFGKVENPGMLKKVQLDWTNIHRKDEVLLGRKDASVGIPYTKWVIKRVETLLVPYPQEESFH
ncbi:unnamed protein product [Vicia faba]|uniref:DUF7745 domain-containing protein n=1 Tax=Vicia faba TaxID=3906 RepID=A0AAV0ZCZ1_VICFA|nr:unnamed protein product [Vicia faba]